MEHSVLIISYSMSTCNSVTAKTRSTWNSSQLNFVWRCEVRSASMASSSAVTWLDDWLSSLVTASNCSLIVTTSCWRSCASSTNCWCTPDTQHINYHCFISANCTVIDRISNRRPSLASVINGHNSTMLFGLLWNPIVSPFTCHNDERCILQCVSKKTSWTFLAVTRESIIGFS